MSAKHLPLSGNASPSAWPGKNAALMCLALLSLSLCLPDIAAASGGITEFSSPLEKVVNTITGPAGKWISIVAMALCGVIFIMNNNAIPSLSMSRDCH